MTATVIDSPVFRRIFSSEPMRRVFSDEHRVQCYLDIEATPACVQARAGLIPHTTGTDEIAAQCTLDSIDMAKLKSPHLASREFLCNQSGGALPD